MKHVNTSTQHRYFKPLLASASVQSAMMVLKPGQSSSDQPENEHPRAEQWVFVISGSGAAKADTLQEAPHGEQHGAPDPNRLVGRDQTDPHR